jgi:hypothetical protein
MIVWYKHLNLAITVDKYIKRERSMCKFIDTGFSYLYTSYKVESNNDSLIKGAGHLLCCNSNLSKG